MKGMKKFFAMACLFTAQMACAARLAGEAENLGIVKLVNKTNQRLDVTLSQSTVGSFNISLKPGAEIVPKVVMGSGLVWNIDATDAQGKIFEGNHRFLPVAQGERQMMECDLMLRGSVNAIVCHWSAPLKQPKSLVSKSIDATVDELAKVNDQKKKTMLTKLAADLYPEIAKKYFLQTRNILDFEKYGLSTPEFEVTLEELSGAAFDIEITPNGWMLIMNGLNLTTVAGLHIPDRFTTWVLSGNKIKSLKDTYFPARLVRLELSGNFNLTLGVFTDEVIAALNKTDLRILDLDKRAFKVDDVRALKRKLKNGDVAIHVE